MTAGSPASLGGCHGKISKAGITTAFILVFQPDAKVGKGHTTLERILRVRECSPTRSIDHGVHMARDALR